MERVSAVYIGRVQGVGFRATTRSIAHRHAVSGWVRNEPDGSVRLEAQGVPEAVQGFLAAIRSQLSPFIRTVHVHPLPQIPTEATFEIQR